MSFGDGFGSGLDETKLVELLGVYGERIDDVVFDLWEGSLILGEGIPIWQRADDGLGYDFGVTLICTACMYSRSACVRAIAKDKPQEGLL